MKGLVIVVNVDKILDLVVLVNVVKTTGLVIVVNVDKISDLVVLVNVVKNDRFGGCDQWGQNCRFGC